MMHASCLAARCASCPRSLPRRLRIARSSCRSSFSRTTGAAVLQAGRSFARQVSETVAVAHPGRAPSGMVPGGAVGAAMQRGGSILRVPSTAGALMVPPQRVASSGAPPLATAGGSSSSSSSTAQWILQQQQEVLRQPPEEALLRSVGRRRSNIAAARSSGAARGGGRLGVRIGGIDEAVPSILAREPPDGDGALGAGALPDTMAERQLSLGDGSSGWMGGLEEEVAGVSAALLSRILVRSRFIQSSWAALQSSHPNILKAISDIGLPHKRAEIANSLPHR